MDRLDCDRMFVTVIETGSFAAAAARLRLSSGQASKMIARLEADLGVQLLKRTTRALAPTEVGQAYYLRVKELLAGYEALEAEIHNDAGAPQGLLRITAPMTFGTMQLVPVLNDFARRFEGVALDVSFSDRVVNVVDEGFDLAIRIGPAQDSSLIARRLCECRLLTLAAPDYLAAMGEPRHPSELAAHRLILDGNLREAGHWQFKGGLRVAVEGRLRYMNGEACLEAAAAGLGIAWLPSFIAGEALRQGRLRHILADFEPAPYPAHAIYPPARHLAGKVRALVDHLAQAWRGVPNWDQGW